MSEHGICTECGAFSYDATLCQACLDGDAAHEGCDDECGVHAEAGELAAENARLTALLAVAEELADAARCPSAADGGPPIWAHAEHPLGCVCRDHRISRALAEWDALKSSKGGGA